MTRFIIKDRLGYTHYINGNKGEYLQTSGEFVQVLQPGSKPGEIGDYYKYGVVGLCPAKFIAAFCRPTSILKEEHEEE